MNGATAYASIAKYGEGYYEEKKSKFLGYAKPCQTEQEALDFIKEIKAKHSDARHQVYAYLIRENNISRYTDDGEPQGTAGIPILDVMKKTELIDLCIIVIRYFGGTLLGTGGLVRAYTAAAKDALHHAGTVEYHPYIRFRLSCGYDDYQKLLKFHDNKKVINEGASFSENVSIDCLCPRECFEEYKLALSDLTNGRLQPQDAVEILYPAKTEKNFDLF